MRTTRTLILFKPDAIQRGVAGKLMTRFEEKGFRIIGCKMTWMTADLARQHYAEHEKKPFFNNLLDFITHGPVMALALEGLSAVSVCRKMIGATNGIEAAPGTIRGDFSQFQSFNLVHGSDSEESAARELGLFFNPNELFDYERHNDPWHHGPIDD